MPNISRSVAPGEMLQGLVMPVLKHCSVVWCLASYCGASGSNLLAGDVLECNLSHHRSVAALCMLCKSGLILGASTLWYIVCASGENGVYTWCLGRSSVFVCTSSLAETCSTAGCLYLTRYIFETILLTASSIV